VLLVVAHEQEWPGREAIGSGRDADDGPVVIDAGRPRVDETVRRRCRGRVELVIALLCATA